MGVAKETGIAVGDRRRPGRLPGRLRVRLRPLFDLVLHASGAERAYLASTTGTGCGTRVELCHSSRPDGRQAPSTTLLRSALGTRTTALLLDPGDAGRMAAGQSVRGLDLRCAVAAPVRALPLFEGALLLDSRFDSQLDPLRLRRVVTDSADALGLMLRHELAAEGDATPGQNADDGQSRLVGSTPAFRKMLSWTDRIAPTRLPVLIEGETGAGKEGVAERLHRLGPCSTGPFVAVNCAALTDTLLDAELFGAVRGAYTGADRDRPGLFHLAQAGTLFLDEVGEMSLAMQSKLLRALETGRVRPVGGDRESSVEVRTVAATHHDLDAAAAAGRLRADLYHRLVVLRIRVPPLRERLEDLPLLVEALGPRLAADTGLSPPRLTRDAWRALSGHDWPGNVRELRAVLARGMLLARGRLIRVRHLGLDRGAVAAIPHGMERSMVASALADARGNVSAAAQRIGWTRNKLYRRIKALGLEVSPDA